MTNSKNIILVRRTCGRSDLKTGLMLKEGNVCVKLLVKFNFVIHVYICKVLKNYRNWDFEILVFFLQPLQKPLYVSHSVKSIFSSFESWLGLFGQIKSAPAETNLTLQYSTGRSSGSDWVCRYPEIHLKAGTALEEAAGRTQRPAPRDSSKGCDCDGSRGRQRTGHRGQSRETPPHATVGTNPVWLSYW